MVLGFTAPRGIKRPGDPPVSTLQKGIYKPGSLGTGQYRAVPGTLPPEL